MRLHVARGAAALAETPEKTAVCVLADKEEIGSEACPVCCLRRLSGSWATVCRTQGVALSDCFANSFCLTQM